MKTFSLFLLLAYAPLSQATADIGLPKPDAPLSLLVYKMEVLNYCGLIDDGISREFNLQRGRLIKSQNLTPEDATRPDVAVVAPEDVELDGLEVEQGDEICGGGGHHVAPVESVLRDCVRIQPVSPRHLGGLEGAGVAPDLVQLARPTLVLPNDRGTPWQGDSMNIRGREDKVGLGRWKSPQVHGVSFEFGNPRS